MRSTRLTSATPFVVTVAAVALAALAALAAACGGVDIGYLDPETGDPSATEAGVTDGDSLPDADEPEASAGDARPDGPIEVVPEGGCEAGATAPCDAAAVGVESDAGDSGDADGA
jgi:hypothetical protein